MADFNKAFEAMLAREGGYGNDLDDPGGETYKGVARKMHPEWAGWKLIDTMKEYSNFPENLDSNPGIQQAIFNFYQSEYWVPIKGDLIASQKMATSIFDFAVNAGIGTSSALAQKVVGVDADGIIGKNTVARLNIFDPSHFVSAFAVEKIRRYIEICKKRPESKKYLLGWADRAVNY
jgi:lysozyme family protein